MITKEKLKNYAGKLMFDMKDEEYDTLLKEFDVILKQMELIENIDNISEVEPMTFPYELDSAEYRDDEEVINVSIDDAFRNTKNKKGREIKVPKVVE